MNLKREQGGSRQRETEEPTPSREPSSLLEWPRREGGRQSQGAQAADRSPKAETSEMIVLPAMVLVFIGAMWLIFAPSSDKEQQPGTGGYNIEMPDADKANRQIIGDKAKAYEQGRWKNGRRTAAVPCRNWAICSTARWRKRTAAGTSTLLIPEMRKKQHQHHPLRNHPIIRSRLPRPQCHARQLLRAAEERQRGNG